MSKYDNHEDWIKSLAEDATIGQAEKRVGLSKATLRRYMSRNNGHLAADHVIKIAMAYNANPARALVETGLIPQEALEVQEPTAADKRKLLLELLEEVDETE
ncbi:hypothetical protein [Corynebacterium sp.]|uniref:hypothetical protein n=1 Tax=Corynebacterium sp. TaxID=1720 RepID=UPI0028AE4D5E|nr:hypothetical protein [Corynebacterium sp.]